MVTNCNHLTLTLALIILILGCLGYATIQSISAILILVSGYYHGSIEYSYVLSNLFFYIVLAILFCRAYLIRRQGFRVLLGIIFALLSLVIWYHVSTENRFSLLAFQYNVIALGLWAGGSCILLAAHEKKVKRRHFSALVKVDTVIRQKSKCAICKVALKTYGVDFHHSDGDRSNNNVSNCNALCTSCHRRMQV
ncbi:MAG TPA: HNH endonuclease signature motif containing protein [Nitrososphaeraceae archaeon]